MFFFELKKNSHILQLLQPTKKTVHPRLTGSPVALLMLLLPPALAFNEPTTWDWFLDTMCVSAPPLEKTNVVRQCPLWLDRETRGKQRGELDHEKNGTLFCGGG